MRILVVDDVGYVRHYLDRLLTQHGHSVVTAASGAQALESLKLDCTIQAVITDLLMPVMDGLDLFRAAQKIERAPGQVSQPPVFFLITALRPTSPGTRREVNLLQQALDLGFADVFLKPIDNDHLLRQLADLEQKLNRGDVPAGAARTNKQADLMREAEDFVEKLAACDNPATIAGLVELLKPTLERLERRAREVTVIDAEQPAGVEQTLEILQSLTDSVLSDENRQAVMTMRRQLSTRADELKEQLTGEAGA
jgi:CheY-like chemotaxis protein